MPQGAWPTSDVIPLGKDVKVRVGAAYQPTSYQISMTAITTNVTKLGCRGGSLTIYGDQHEIGDTEDTNSAGPGLGTNAFKAFQTGRQEADIELHWYRTNTLIPQAPLGNTPTGLNFNIDAYISMWIWPAAGQGAQSGAGVILNSYQFPIVNINRYGNPFDIGQPQEGRITGKNVGPFFPPQS